MVFHSIPEGVAVGVGYGSETHKEALGDLRSLIAIAISIHNMPEGLGVALPLRAAGALLETLLPGVSCQTASTDRSPSCQLAGVAA